MNRAPCSYSESGFQGLRASLRHKPPPSAKQHGHTATFWTPLCPGPAPPEVRTAHAGAAHGPRGRSRDAGHQVRNVRNKTELKPLAHSSTMRKKKQNKHKKHKEKEIAGSPRLFWQGSCCSIPHSGLWDGNQTIGGPHSSWAYTRESRELLHRSPRSGVNPEWRKNRGPGSLAMEDVQRLVRKQPREMPCARGSFAGRPTPSPILPALPTSHRSPPGPGAWRRAKRSWGLPDEQGVTGAFFPALQETRLGYDHVWLCKGRARCSKPSGRQPTSSQNGRGWKGPLWVI